MKSRLNLIMLAKDDCMIYYLLLLCLPLANCCQNIAQKQYTLRTKAPNVILFSAVTSVMALGFFLITSGLKLEFSAGLIPYALAFAAGYSAGWVGTVLAVRYGLMAISTLIVSCSLIFPTIYGILLGEPLTPTVLVGMALLLAAIVLVNLKFDKSSRFSWKWFICVMVAFFGNGVCSISQNMQKRALGDSYSHEFMILALAAASAMLLGYALLTSEDFKGDFRRCLPFSAANGAANAVINFLMLVLIGNIPNTILYPTSSALNMAGTFLLAFFAYKERFSKMQYVGYVLGIASIVLLNI